MNKTDLINSIAESADLPKAAAGRALDAFIGAVVGSLQKGEPVTIVGFGTFETRKRPARKGRNPKTGEELLISEKVVPGFKGGKSFKDAVADQK